MLSLREFVAVTGVSSPAVRTRSASHATLARLLRERVERFGRVRAYLMRWRRHRAEERERGGISVCWFGVEGWWWAGEEQEEEKRRARRTDDCEESAVRSLDDSGASVRNIGVRNCSCTFAVWRFRFMFSPGKIEKGRLESQHQRSGDKYCDFVI